MKPYDEKDIGHCDPIIRRINPRHHVVFYENNKCNRLSSKAFSPSTKHGGGMSVDIKKLMDMEQVDAAEFVTTPEYIGSVIFNAGAARIVELIIGYEPIEENPYHGEVWDRKGRNRFNKSQKNALLLTSEWFVEIPNVRIIAP